MKTRTIRCFPSEENEILERMHLLGYKLMQRNEIDNIREVYDGSVSVTRGNYTGTDVYTHTERNHYLSLLFEKDIDDQDLDDKLSALEKEVDKTVDILDKNYDTTYNLTQKLKKQKAKLISSIVLMVLGLLEIVFGFVMDAMYPSVHMNIAIYLIMGIVVIATGIVFLLMALKARKTLPQEIESHKKVIDGASDNLEALLREAKKFEPAVKANYKK